MIRLEHLSIEKQPNEHGPLPRLDLAVGVVLVSGTILAVCDAEVEAEEFIGTVHLRTAVLNNFTFKEGTEAMKPLTYSEAAAFLNVKVQTL